MIGIYMITNTINGKRYIGQSKQITKRLAQHRRAACDSMVIHRAIRKYGWELFEVSVLYVLEDKALLNEYECKAIEEHSPEYNMKSGGQDTNTFKPEVIEKMRETRKGRVFTEEWRDNISKSQTGNLNNRVGSYRVTYMDDTTETFEKMTRLDITKQIGIGICNFKLILNGKRGPLRNVKTIERL